MRCVADNALYILWEMHSLLPLNERSISSRSYLLVSCMASGINLTGMLKEWTKDRQTDVNMIKWAVCSLMEWCQGETSAYLCVQEGGVSQSQSKVSAGQQSQGAVIQKEAAVDSFCTHRSSVDKQRYLDQRDGLLFPWVQGLGLWHYGTYISKTYSLMTSSTPYTFIHGFFHFL